MTNNEKLIAEAFQSNDPSKMFEALLTTTYPSVNDPQNSQEKAIYEAVFMTSAIMIYGTMLKAFHIETSHEETERIIDTVGKSIADYKAKCAKKNPYPDPSKN